MVMVLVVVILPLSVSRMSLIVVVVWADKDVVSWMKYLAASLIFPSPRGPDEFDSVPGPGACSSRQSTIVAQMGNLNVVRSLG
jgi:hypothetical protein